ncbi:VOC family protein [Jiella sonneratiae]|uniref:VOC family protein n=1 Tax=Jiella sonneratiae TaxID=2816856 RepID=A0ABS3J9W6_9HYPH|nr:VOC family protein [Jiella sonneratiae]MBO0906452.1 VOC family protein [Jiella sonneratiae]
MTEHLGRLFDHVHIRVADIAASRRFYEAVLGALGHRIEGDGEDFWCDEFYVSAADGAVSRLHFAFQAKDHEAVAAFHTAGLAAGGRDNGAPGLRDYHAGYFAAFLLDPDGNNVEAVHHGPTNRSAASVTVERVEPEDHP